MVSSSDIVIVFPVKKFPTAILIRWVLMPPEVLPDAFLCDESCSKGKEDDINVLGWYTHVLPQIRNR